MFINPQNSVLIRLLTQISRHPPSSCANYELCTHYCEDSSLWYIPECYDLGPLPWSIRTSHPG